MQVIPSRVLMAGFIHIIDLYFLFLKIVLIVLIAPAMFIPPLIMSKLEKTAAFVKNPWLKAPTTVSLQLINSLFSF